MASLSKHEKDRMIRSIMADIPRPDIEKLAAEEFCAAVDERLPEAIKKALKDPKAREYVNTQTVYTDCGRVRFPCHAPCGHIYRLVDWEPYAGEEAVKRLRDRCAEVRARDDARSEMQAALAANFSGVRTVKQFEERFPELAKYLPAKAVTANLPATSDLVDRLKAAGLKGAE